MKKTSLLVGAVILTISLAQAEEGKPAVQPVQAIKAVKAVPAVVTTGDKAVDEQVKALTKEMEEKIKGIREEYMAKIKAVTAGKKPMVVKPNGATTTVKEVRKEIKEERKEVREERKEERKEVRAENASTTRPQGAVPARPAEKAQGFFRNIFNR